MKRFISIIYMSLLSISCGSPSFDNIFDSQGALGGILYSISFTTQYLKTNIGVDMSTVNAIFTTDATDTYKLYYIDNNDQTHSFSPMRDTLGNSYNTFSIIPTIYNTPKFVIFLTNGGSMVAGDYIRMDAGWCAAIGLQKSDGRLFCLDSSLTGVNISYTVDTKIKSNSTGDILYLKIWDGSIYKVIKVDLTDIDNIAISTATSIGNTDLGHWEINSANDVMSTIASGGAKIISADGSITNLGSSANYECFSSDTGGSGPASTDFFYMKFLTSDTIFRRSSTDLTTEIGISVTLPSSMCLTDSRQNGFKNSSRIFFWFHSENDIIEISNNTTANVRVIAGIDKVLDITGNDDYIFILSDDSGGNESVLKSTGLPTTTIALTGYDIDFIEPAATGDTFYFFGTKQSDGQKLLGKYTSSGVTSISTSYSTLTALDVMRN